MLAWSAPPPAAEPIPAGTRRAAVAAVVAIHLLAVGAFGRREVAAPEPLAPAIEATLVDPTPVAPPPAPAPRAAEPSREPAPPRPAGPPRRAAAPKRAEPPPIARPPDATPEPAQATRPPEPSRPAEPSAAERPAPEPLPAPAAAAAPAAPAATAAPQAPAAATAPVPAAPPEPRTVAIGAVRYLQPPTLDYPLAARRAREEGRVHVRVRVDPQGRPAQAAVVRSSGFPRLDASALAAAQATRFVPYTENGAALPFWVVMPLVFELEN